MSAPHLFLDRFLAVARAHGDRPALVQGGSRLLRYAELVREVRDRAGWLHEQGVGPGDVVGLAVGRSVEHIVGLLAAWWLGAAFVPIDPAAPALRRELFRTDAGARVVLQGPLPRSGDEGSQDRSATRPGDLAYILYTSGSTGRPKGVAVEHRSIVPLLEAQVEAFALGPDSRSLWLLSPAFDASISDLGTALLSGATLFIEADEAVRDPTRLVGLLHDRRITHIDLPPALLGVIDPGELPDCLQTVIVGGEPSPPALVRRWAAQRRVVNVYGPTEATVCTSLCVCDPQRWSEPLLGRPLPGVSYHVLDEELRPVPPGGTGELGVAGECLARGYVNQPGLTLAKFIDWQGRRLYRTGDRVLWREDGEYVFLGRIDRQVKVRGQLVEPEEVEARLREHPGVRQAAVVKRRLGGDPPRDGLVAFIEPAGPGLKGLSAWLAGRLPAWMLPQRVVPIETLPRTAGGKIDLPRLIDWPLIAREGFGEGGLPNAIRSKAEAAAETADGEVRGRGVGREASYGSS